VTVYFFHGKPCIIAQDLGQLLGYSGDGRSLVELFRNKWKQEFVVGRDIQKLTGEALREFKEIARRGLGPRRAHVNKLTILTESGMDLVCMTTDKPLSETRRRFFVDEVFTRPHCGEPMMPFTSRPKSHELDRGLMWQCSGHLPRDACPA
jgi:hypothetical protein